MVAAYSDLLRKLLFTSWFGYFIYFLYLLKRLFVPMSSLVMGLGQKFRPGSGQPLMVFIWKFSPKNVKFFNFCPSGKKNLFGSSQKVTGSKGGRPLIYSGSKVSSGRVGSGQGLSLPMSLLHAQTAIDQSSPSFVQTSTPTQGRFLTQVWPHLPDALTLVYPKLQNLNRSREKKLCET